MEVIGIRATCRARLVYRVSKIRRTFVLDTQLMRLRILRDLQQLFDMASSLAYGESRLGEEKPERKSLEMKQRQMWTRVAANVAQIITAVTEKFDDQKIDKDLDELERLLNEARAKSNVSGTEEENPKNRETANSTVKQD